MVFDNHDLFEILTFIQVDRLNFELYKKKSTINDL